MSLAFANAGAKLVVGIDISEVSIRNASEIAERDGLSSRTRFLQRDCEATGLPSDSFDLVLCSGMLHHLNLERAFPELDRLLRPGVEALNYNPAIKLYRRLTPQHRTVWESKHILSLREVRYAKKWFKVERMRFFCMAAPLATILPRGSLRNVAMRVGQAIDSALTRLPFVRL